MIIIKFAVVWNPESLINIDKMSYLFIMNLASSFGIVQVIYHKYNLRMTDPTTM